MLSLFGYKLLSPSVVKNIERNIVRCESTTDLRIVSTESPATEQHSGDWTRSR